MTRNKYHTHLKLSASFNSWRLYSARKADERFKAYEHKVFERDNYTCQYCGFQAKIHQEVVNLDYNFKHNQLSNLVTACCFCAQCFFIESIGVGGYGGGNLIYLPEISQAELNSFCHVLFCAIANDTGYKGSAQTLYRSFRQRTQLVEEKFGEGTSDPAIFGQLIIDSGISQDVTDKLLTNIRLLPSRARFRVQIEQWAATALEELTEAK